MEIVLGIAIVLVSLPCWGGQAISFLAPSTAERWKLTEAESSVDAVFYGEFLPAHLWLILILEAAAIAFIGNRVYQHYDRRVIKFL